VSPHSTTEAAPESSGRTPTSDADVSGSVKVAGSGWLLLRAWSQKAHPLVLDIYPFATTSPIYVNVDGQPARSREDAAYFVHWIDRVIATLLARGDYNSAAEKSATLHYLESARAVYEAMQ